MGDYDWSKVSGRITEKFGTKAAFAAHIRRTATFVSMVLNGKSILKQDDIEEWAEALEIKPCFIGDYFFNHKVQ